MTLPGIQLSSSQPGVRVAELPLDTAIELPSAESRTGDGCVEELPAVTIGGDAPLWVAEIEGAIIGVTPETRRCYLLTRDRELVLDAVDSSANVRKRAARDLDHLAALGEIREAEDRILLAPTQRIFGYWHWWLDVMARIWLADEHGPPEDRGLPIAFPPRTRPFEEDSLDALELRDRVTTLEPGLTRFASVTFTPGLTGGHSRQPSAPLEEYAGWARDRLGLRLDGGRRRLYVSRSDARRRRVANEDDLASVLAEREVETITCSDLSSTEQAQSFADAAIVIGAHGAGLTNLLFASPGTDVIEVFGSNAQLDVSNYRVLAAHLGHGYTRLVADPTGRKWRKGGHHVRDMALNPGVLAAAIDELDA